MAVNILVATPQPAIGELLRLSLEESGKYRVRLVQSGSEALSAAGRIPFDLAILDSTLPDQPFVSLAQSLCAANSGLRLVIIPPENDPARLSLDGLHPDAILSLPFYVPDLLDLVGSLLGPAEHWQAAGAGRGEPLGEPLPSAAFMGDQVEVAAHLIELLGQTTAQAGFIIRYRLLWIFQGALDQQQVENVAAVLLKAWDDSNPGDLARFVRPLESGPEFLLYATAIVPGVLLGLVYEPSLKLTRIRTQARQTAHALRPLANLPPSFSTPPPAADETVPPPTDVQPAPLPAAGPTQAPDQEMSPEELEDLLSAAPASGQDASDLLQALQEADAGSTSLTVSGTAEPGLTAPDSSQSSAALAEEPPDAPAENELPQVSLTDLLAAMPPPDPEERSQAPGSEWVAEAAAEDENGGFLFPWEMEAPTGTAAPDAPIDEKASYLFPRENETESGPVDFEPAAEEKTEVQFPWEKETESGPVVPEPASEINADLVVPGEKETESGPVIPEPAAEEKADYQFPWEKEAESGPVVPEAAADAKTDYQFPWQAEAVSGPAAVEPAAEISPALEQAPTSDPATLEDTKPIPRSVLLGAHPEPQPVEPVQALPPQAEAEAEVPPQVPPTAEADAENEPAAGSTQAEEPAAIPLAELAQALPELPDEWVPSGEDEPSPLDFATLAYTCMLIPALPIHQLSGRLAKSLDELLPQICLAYGWKLESHKILPDYLEWTVKVSPVITPSSVVRLVRLQTSQHIFGQFGRLAAQIPSGDFWAPGYLITSGAESPQETIIKEFIEQTRKRQRA